MGEIERIQRVAPAFNPVTSPGKVAGASGREGGKHHHPKHEDIVELGEQDEGSQPAVADSERDEPDGHLDIAV